MYVNTLVILPDVVLLLAQVSPVREAFAELSKVQMDIAGLVRQMHMMLVEPAHATQVEDWLEAKASLRDRHIRTALQVVDRQLAAKEAVRASLQAMEEGPNTQRRLLDEAKAGHSPETASICTPRLEQHALVAAMQLAWTQYQAGMVIMCTRCIEAHSTSVTCESLGRWREAELQVELAGAMLAVRLHKLDQGLPDLEREAQDSLDSLVSGLLLKLGMSEALLADAQDVVKREQEALLEVGQAHV